MLFSNHVRSFLAVVLGRLDVLLFEPLRYQINGNPLDLDGKRRKSVAEQMRFEHNRLSCARLKDQAVQEETHASGNGMVIEMFAGVLKEIGRRGKTMASLMSGIKWNTGKGFSWLQLLMLTEHVCSFLDQVDGFLANSIIVTRLSPLSLRQKAEHVTDTWGLIFCSWRRIIH